MPKTKTSRSKGRAKANVRAKSGAKVEEHHASLAKERQREGGKAGGKGEVSHASIESRLQRFRRTVAAARDDAMFDLERDGNLAREAVGEIVATLALSAFGVALKHARLDGTNDDVNMFERISTMLLLAYATDDRKSLLKLGRQAHAYLAKNYPDSSEFVGWKPAKGGRPSARALLLDDVRAILNAHTAPEEIAMEIILRVRSWFPWLVIHFASNGHERAYAAVRARIEAAPAKVRSGPRPLDPVESLVREILSALGVPQRFVNAAMNEAGK